MEAKGWAIVETGSAAGLDGSIAKAAERGENWFGYYWSPTAIIGKYDICLLYTSPSPRDGLLSRMPSSA